MDNEVEEEEGEEEMEENVDENLTEEVDDVAVFSPVLDEEVEVLADVTLFSPIRSLSRFAKDFILKRKLRELQ